VKESEVSASDAGDCGNRLRAGEIGFIKSEAQFTPLLGQNEGEFIALPEKTALSGIAESENGPGAA